MDMPLTLPILFFFIALFYAMVGFGGGSSYIAVLVLLGFSYQSIPVVALICNLVVTIGGSWHFYRAGHLKLNLIVPFLLLSVPMAYLGGSIHVSKEIFCLILGVALFAVALRMFLPVKELKIIEELNPKISLVVRVFLGGVLGFLAGLVGIGGGIFLSPILILMKWANAKQAAACASIFIVVNSAAGLVGHLGKGVIHLQLLIPLAFVVFLGGQIGSRLGAYHVPRLRLQRFVAILVFYVSVKLLMKGAI